MTTPFRWNISRREQLGRLVKDDPEVDAECVKLIAPLRQATARILALGDDADYAFIGRTPENFYDYLSGIFHGVSGTPSVHIVQFSLRWAGPEGLESIPVRKRHALFDYLTEEGVDPASMACAPRPLALVDFVADGGTMENFVTLMYLQAQRDGVDWNAVQRRLRIIGLRQRSKNSPNTWRWQQHQDWLDRIPDAAIKNVSVPWEFLLYLGNNQPKVTEPHMPACWDRYAATTPAYSAPQLQALNLAVRLFDLGRSIEERRALAGLIAKQKQVRQPATRALISRLKRAGD